MSVLLKFKLEMLKMELGVYYLFMTYLLHHTYSIKGDEVMRNYGNPTDLMSQDTPDMNSSAPLSTSNIRIMKRHRKVMTTKTLTTDTSEHAAADSLPGLIAFSVLYFLLLVSVSCGVIAACCFRRRTAEAELQMRLSRAASSHRSSIHAAILEEHLSNSAMRGRVAPRPSIQISQEISSGLSRTRHHEG